MTASDWKKTLNNQQKSSKDPNFRLLSQMIRKGKLDIRLILASPRTGSTLLETSFIKNSTINTCAHEPFRHSKNIEDVKEGYEAIFKKIKSRASINLMSNFPFLIIWLRSLKFGSFEDFC